MEELNKKYAQLCTELGDIEYQRYRSSELCTDTLSFVFNSCRKLMILNKLNELRKEADFLKKEETK